MANLDPYCATRREYTQGLTSIHIPDSANQKYTLLMTDLKQLLTALAEHPAMADNLEQTYMTPANYKNKVYFMWDFVGRTLGMLAVVPSSSGPLWDDCTGRSKLSSVLITDTTGKLEAMCPNDRGEQVQFGLEILAIAERLGK